MRTLAAAVTAVVLSLGLSASSARAGKPASEDAAQAKEHYKRGTKLYDLGKYDEAIQEFEAAFEIKDEPVLLYNIAQAYRLANKYPEALRFYRTYLRRSPRAPNKSEVEAKIADMENLIAQQNKVATAAPADAIPPGARPPATTPPPPSATPPSSPPGEPPPAVASAERSSEPARTEPQEVQPSRPEPAKTEPPRKVEAPPPQPEAPKPGNGKLIGGIVIAALGVACVGAGVGMGVLAMSKASQQETSNIFLPDVQSTGQTMQTVGLALDVVGGAAIATGLVVAIVGARQNRQASDQWSADHQKVTFVPSLGPSFAGGTLRLRF